MPKPPESSDFKAVPLPKPQTTVARCTTVIDIGTVPESYLGDVKIMRKIYIGWELPKLLAIFNEEKGEQPFNIGLELTFSTNEKANFSKLVSNWRNRPLSQEEKKTFDPIVMINKPAMISFIHKRKTKYRNSEITEVTNENSWLVFNGISQLPEGMVCPPMISKKMVWDWDLITEGKEEFSKEKFEALPKWIREKMLASEEFRKYAKGYDEAAADSNTADPDTEAIEDTDTGGW